MNPQIKALLEKPHVRDVFDIFDKNGVEVRVVGGAVRDALLGREIHDIDMAVACTPDEATHILESHALVKPTGLKFGTITVVFPHNHFQITSLRKDVNTDGRHAEVVFGGTFEEDALRRDFTINALSLDVQGTLFDYFGGQEDLQLGHIRFIGDALTRIKEDYLRILRFFRMQAFFGKDVLDKDALKACADLKQGLQHLSRERIRMEFFKILTAPHATKIISIMDDTGILNDVCEGADVNSFLDLVKAEQKYEVASHPLRRLLALYPQKSLESLDEKFVLTRMEYGRIEQLSHISKDDNLTEILYRHGKDVARDHILLHCPDKGKEALLVIEGFVKPSFPILPKHLMELGFSGKALGDALHKLESIWIKSNFTLTQEELLRECNQN